MSDLTTNESADVLMHKGQQYVRVDYLTRAKAEVAELKRERDALREGIRKLHSGTGEDGDPCEFCNLAGYT